MGTNGQKMAKFSKVSFDQFKKDWLNTFQALQDVEDKSLLDNHIKEIYEAIKLPERATYMSAGYDFFSPVKFTLQPNECITIPTGVRCEMYDGWVLSMYPRSGHGFKSGMHLANTVAIIDGDYYDADNEGHIMVKLVNDSSIAIEVTVEDGTAICQGMFSSFGITLDDNATEVRHGGFGSTDK